VSVYFDALHQGPEMANNKEAHPIVKLLIEKGANVDARTTKNWTPLFDASRWDAYEIMDYLVQKGADVRAVDIDGNSPLHIAVSFYKNETTKQVLKQGVPINTQNKKGQTALHIASKPRVAPKEQPLVIATLLSAGADKTIKDADNKTAYDIVKKSSRFSKTLL
jgi:ankyrin repeat protein